MKVKLTFGEKTELLIIIKVAIEEAQEKYFSLFVDEVDFDNEMSQLVAIENKLSNVGEIVLILGDGEYKYLYEMLLGKLSTLLGFRNNSTPGEWELCYQSKFKNIISIINKLGGLC